MTIRIYLLYSLIFASSVPTIYHSANSFKFQIWTYRAYLGCESSFHFVNKRFELDQRGSPLKGVLTCSHDSVEKGLYSLPSKKALLCSAYFSKHEVTD